MGRVIRSLIVLALITFGLLWPLAFRGGATASGVDDPVVFTDYKANFVVNNQGRLDAVETITADFPEGRHGIFRYWDIANQNNPGVRQRPDIASILLDGQPAPYQMLWEDGERFRVAKIGDPNQYLPAGTHVFEMRYTIDGVLDPASTGADKTFAQSTGAPTTTGSVFYWNVIAPSWNNRIERADISITLPGGVPRVQCSIGYGVGAPCGDLTITGNTVTLSAQVPGFAHPRHRARERRRADPTARRIAVAIHVGPHSRHVAGRSAVDGSAHRGVRARRVPVVPHHGRTIAGVPAAVRAAAGARAGTTGVHPHRGGSQERPHRDAAVSRRAQAGRAAAGQRGEVAHPGARGQIRVGRCGPGQRRGRVGAQGHRARLGLRGHENGEVRRETQQGQDRHDQQAWRAGRSATNSWSSANRTSGCAGPTRSRSS